MRSVSAHTVAALLIFTLPFIFAGLRFVGFLRLRFLRLGFVGFIRITWLLRLARVT